MNPACLIYLTLSLIFWLCKKYAKTRKFLYTVLAWSAVCYAFLVLIWMADWNPVSWIVFTGFIMGLSLAIRSWKTISGKSLFISTFLLYGWTLFYLMENRISYPVPTPNGEWLLPENEWLFLGRKLLEFSWGAWLCLGLFIFYILSLWHCWTLLKKKR